VNDRDHPVRVLAAAVASVMLIAVASAGEPQRRHSAHEHGRIDGGLAQDGNWFELTLSIPGVNVVGFEHTPHDDAQRAALDSARQRLVAGNWIALDQAGECVQPRVTVATVGYGVTDSVGSQAGGRGHAHRDHGEFRVRAEIECARADRLAWIELAPTGQRPASAEIELDVLTEARIDRVRLSTDRPRVRLR